MAQDWMKVGMDVVSGGAAGVLDQVIQNQDDKRATEKQAAGQTLGLMQQYGTYLNYAVPILSIVSVAMGWLRGDWATRAAVAGSQLAGRKVTWQMTKKKETPGYAFTGWHRSRELEKLRQLEAARAKGGAGTPAMVGMEF